MTPLPSWNWRQAEAGLPRQALMLTVAADPLDPNRLWGGYYAPGGLATSYDGGRTWTTGADGLADNPVFDLLPQLISVDGTTEVELWAATRDGLLGSTDAGTSWQPVTAGLPGVTPFALAADATGRLYVGLDGAGVYAKGDTWKSLVEPASPLASAAVLSLAVSPDGQFLYAGTSGQGVFSSWNGGGTWTAHYGGKYAANVAVNPTNPRQAIASLREQTVGDEDLAKLIEDLSTRDQLVRTNDGGQTWHILPLAWANDEVPSLLWLPDGTLGAGTGNGRIYRSIDDGDTWQQGGTGLPYGAILDLAVAGSNNGSQRFLAATWKGLFASDDDGRTWHNLAPSLGTPQVRALLALDETVLLGTQNGLYRWQPDAHSWVPLGDRLLTGVASLAADPNDPRRLYAGTAGDGVYRSDDAGQTWQRLPAQGVGVPDLVVDPRNSNHLTFLAAWERVYETYDGGQTWQARWRGLGDVVETVCLAFDPLEPVTYVGTEYGLYRSRESGNWKLIAPELLGQSVLALQAQAVSTGGPNDSLLYIGTTRGAFRSVDLGETLQGPADDSAWGVGLEDISVTAFLLDPQNPQVLYAGTAYNGVYQSADGGKTWHAIGPAELPEDVVESMAWGPDGELFIVTTSGVWLGHRE